MRNSRLIYWLVLLLFISTACSLSTLPDIEGNLTQPPTLVLNEVLLFDQQQPQFIELKNASEHRVLLSGLKLKNELGEIYTLPNKLPPLDTGGIFWIVFDGRGFYSGENKIHASLSRFVTPTSGTLTLMDRSSAVLDQLAWGQEWESGVTAWDPVHSEDAALAGSTLGRYPLSTAVGPDEWVLYSPELSTPGEPNPVPIVSSMHPENGTIEEQDYIYFSWDPIPGAAWYLLQMGADEQFDLVLAETAAFTPGLLLQEVPPGLYYWRVQVVDEVNEHSNFSPVHSIELRPPLDDAHALHSEPGNLFAVSLITPLNAPVPIKVNLPQ